MKEELEKICEKCEHHTTVFEGYFGIEKVENLRFICSSERYGIKRDLYCSNGHDCKFLKEFFDK